MILSYIRIISFQSLLHLWVMSLLKASCTNCAFCVWSLVSQCSVNLFFTLRGHTLKEHCYLKVHIHLSQHCINQSRSFRGFAVPSWHQCHPAVQRFAAVSHNLVNSSSLYTFKSTLATCLNPVSRSSSSCGSLLGGSVLFGTEKVWYFNALYFIYKHVVALCCLGACALVDSGEP